METPTDTSLPAASALPAASPLPIEAVLTELKAVNASPGYKTTEFWMHVCIILALLLAASAGFLDPKWAALCASAASSFYALSRGLSKQGNSH